MSDTGSEAIASEIAKKFIARRDVKAIQFEGGYRPVTDGRNGPRLPWKMADLVDHVEGRKTFGHYMVGTDDQCKLFAFDVDLTKRGPWRDDAGITHEIDPRAAWLDENHPARPELVTHLRYVAEGLAKRTERLVGVPVAVAYSGNKGLHVYAFTGPVPAAEARAAARAVIDSYQSFEPKRGDNFFMHVDGHYPNVVIEIYPKQDGLDGKDLGNLMRLPLGVNRSSGHEAFFIDQEAEDHLLVPADPMSVLGS